MVVPCNMYKLGHLPQVVQITTCSMSVLSEFSVCAAFMFFRGVNVFYSFACVLSFSLSFLKLQGDDARPQKKSQFGIIHQPSSSLFGTLINVYFSLICIKLLKHLRCQVLGALETSEEYIGCVSSAAEENW